MTVARLKHKQQPILPEAGKPLRIHLGIGAAEGAIKIGPGHMAPDRALDPRALPWPIESESVEMLSASFYLHRLPLPERHAFMDEVWRVLRPGGQAVIIVPHYMSIRSLSDPLAHWPPVTDASFEWYRKAWREAENMQHDLRLECDFAVAAGYIPQGDYLAGRSEEFTQHAIAHEWNAVADLHATLTKLG